MAHIRIGDRFSSLRGPVRGWIAVGHCAIGGLFAFGGMAIAPVSIGFCAFGLITWGALAAAHLRDWRRVTREGPARVVAITGSAGKTTTKDLCAALLATVAPSYATPGNLNNRVGLPAVILGLEALHTFAVLEMGMSLRDEIAQLAEVAPPDVAIITNVGMAHAGGVGGSRADVAREKGALYAALTASVTSRFVSLPPRSGVCRRVAFADASRASSIR